MLTRKKKYPLRIDSGGSVDDGRPGTPAMRRKDSEITATKTSVGRMSTRSDIVVEKSPNERPNVLNNAARRIDRDVVKDTSKVEGGRESDTSSLSERGKQLALDLLATKSGTETVENTPALSVNGSVSGTSVTPRIHGKNTKIKGSTHSLSSDSSSDHEDMPEESLSQLSSSLKLSQSRASSLSANFTQLMRLVLEMELEALDKEIAQVKNGSHEAVKIQYREAHTECEAKKKIAEARWTATKTEIDIRFGAMVGLEWSKFKNDKLELRQKMCSDIASTISSLQAEQDQARLLKVGVRSSSALQRAPWWVKIPKQFTWLNLPDGVNDDQIDKDLARMGIIAGDQTSDSIGIRTPSPDDAPRKRKRKHSSQDDRKRPRMESYTSEDFILSRDLDNRYPHSAGPTLANPKSDSDDEIMVQNEDRSAESLMNSLLQVVEDDIQTVLEPPLPMWPSHPQPYNFMPYHYGEPPAFPAPLLPRPSMMPTGPYVLNNFMPFHNIQPRLRPIEPATLPPLRLDTNEGFAKLSVLAEQPPTLGSNTILPIQPRISEIPILPIQPAELPSTEPSHLTTVRSSAEYPHPLQPPVLLQEQRPIESAPTSIHKPIAPRPGSTPPPSSSLSSRPTPIQPSPSTKSRAGSISPEVLRTKRPLTLLPKVHPTQSTPQTLPPQYPTPEDDRPAKERYPLSRFSEAKPPIPACTPPPPPSMGRFSGVRSTEGPFVQFPPNPKIAIPRNPSQVGHEGPAPLRIAPAPAKRIEPRKLQSEADLPERGKTEKESIVTTEIRRKTWDTNHIERGIVKDEGGMVGQNEEHNEERDIGGVMEGGRSGLRSSNFRKKLV